MRSTQRRVFESSGRFYEGSGARLGMTPSEYRQGGKSTEIQFATAKCSLGARWSSDRPRGACVSSPWATTTPRCSVNWRRSSRRHSRSRGTRSSRGRSMPWCGAIEAPAKEWSLPSTGTVFQQRVLESRALRQIPPGTTKTYTEIAEILGMPKAGPWLGRARRIRWRSRCRAIASFAAMARLRHIALVLERKRKLLDRERQT